MKKYGFVFLYFFLFFNLKIIAQNNSFSVAGDVWSSNKTPAISATVTLHKITDSSLVKVTLTNDKGNFVLNQLKEGNYFIKISYTGYQTYYSDMFLLNNANSAYKLSTIQLQPKAKVLNSVTVSAVKPLIEKKADRLIFNVDNSIIATGSTAIEILDYAPGVSVDNNGVIAINGKTNVLVMIDGKPSSISIADLSTYLKTISSNTIEKIEIITNPSARYDAAGSGGIINIRLKKDQKLGLNGTVVASYGQGVYGKTNDNIALNYRDKKVNVFGNYTFSFQKNFEKIYQYRNLLNNGQLFNVYDQYNYNTTTPLTHTFRIGSDFFITKNTTIGLLFSASISDLQKKGYNETHILDNHKNPDGWFRTDILSNDDWKTSSGNLNLKHVFGNTDKELNIDLSAVKYTSSKPPTFITNYFDNANNITKTDILIGNFDGKIDVRIVKLDYTHPINKNIKIDIGIKNNFAKTDNDAKFFNRKNNVDVYDTSLSNHFIYYENVNAGYVIYNEKFKQFSIEAGLRGEQTIINNRQLTTGSIFKTDYFQLFPSFSLNHKIGTKHDLTYSISRRIDRPDYQQLNPFKIFYDPSTYDEGNPYLLPQLTYSFEISHAYNDKFFTTLNYSHTTNSIVYVVLQSPQDPKISVLNIKNIKAHDYFSVNINTPITITKWWKINNNLTLAYNKYQGNLENITFQNVKPSFDENIINSFSFPKNWTAELSFVYRSGSIHAISPYEPIYRLNMGIQKSILQRRGILKLSIRDILYSQFAQASTKFANVDETYKQRLDSRIATFSFTYKLGKKTVTASRKRETGLETEQDRIQAEGK